MKDGLIPVIAQDAVNNNVLMLAWADRRALALTRKTGLMHYYSRSRGRLWRKGETSGHVQRVQSLHYDCDRDVILARVRQTGPACHKGQYSCFSTKSFGGVLGELEGVVRDRAVNPRRGSYTQRLLGDAGLRRDKLLEEMSEFAAAAKSRRKKDVTSEAADVLYHLLVELVAQGLSLADVEAELGRRRR
jgi:phosphoribosyl-ATP pyrophosphohydrolase/phosphoribosyl-AMP cyclohydrolase